MWNPLENLTTNQQQSSERASEYEKNPSKALQSNSPSNYKFNLHITSVILGNTGIGNNEQKGGKLYM